MKNIPDKIYLQIGDDADLTIDNSVNDFNDLYKGAITWNDERINKNDIEYERRQDANLKSAALPIYEAMARYLLPDEILGKFARLLELGAKMRNGGLETDEYEESENLFEEFRETYF